MKKILFITILSAFAGNTLHAQYDLDEIYSVMDISKIYNVSPSKGEVLEVIPLSGWSRFQRKPIRNLSFSKQFRHF